MASFPEPVEYKIVRNVQSVRTYVTELDQSNTPIMEIYRLYIKGYGNMWEDMGHYGWGKWSELVVSWQGWLQIDDYVVLTNFTFRDTLTCVAMPLPSKVANCSPDVSPTVNVYGVRTAVNQIISLTIQFITIRCDAIRYDTIRYNTIQYTNFYSATSSGNPSSVEKQNKIIWAKSNPFQNLSRQKVGGNARALFSSCYCCFFYFSVKGRLSVT